MGLQPIPRNNVRSVKVFSIALELAKRLHGLFTRNSAGKSSRKAVSVSFTLYLPHAHVYFSALTRLSHNDKANCIASALFDYEHYLDAMPEDEKKKMPRSHAVRCDMTMTQSIRDFTCLVNKSGPQFFNIEVLKDKDPDGDKAWASAPALGRHLRECVAARLEAGFDDHTLVECIRHDGQFREEGAPAKFYAFVYMPWEVMLRAVHHRNLKVAVEHLGDEVRLHAGNPRFKIDWATGRILDDVLDRKSSVPNI